MQPEVILKALFTECETRQGSDIHIASSLVPRLRVHGLLDEIPGMAPVSGAEADDIAVLLGATSFPSRENAKGLVLSALMEKGAIDGSYTSPAGCRYRFNIFRENSRTAIALRRLDDRFLSLAELNLPANLADFCNCRDGLFIVTGPTGSGKSTTLATLIDIINRTRSGHIITIEDPVEYIHKSQKCLVNQRQVGRDAASFNAALVESLRQDPDVILVGEIREVETIRTAITAAETGHLVFTTLHAGDCIGAVERMISVFPAGEQDGIRHQLAMVLRGIFAQHLLPVEKGERRVAACELMVVTQAIANLIASGRSNQIYSAIETGQSSGMLTLDQSLAGLCSAGLISEFTACAISKNPDMLKSRIGTGRTSRKTYGN